MGLAQGIFASSVLYFFLSSAAYGEHNEFEWHLLKSEATIEHCQRVLHEGKVIGMLSNNKGGYDVALYFGGNLYEVEFQFGIQISGCKAYRISHANRQSQRR